MTATTDHYLGIDVHKRQAQVLSLTTKVGSSHRS
jgi:hypothetical protein